MRFTGFYKVKKNKMEWWECMSVEAENKGIAKKLIQNSMEGHYKSHAFSIKFKKVDNFKVREYIEPTEMELLEAEYTKLPYFWKKDLSFAEFIKRKNNKSGVKS